MFKTILVAITNDDKKEKVLNYAIGMAKRYKSDLVITHINQIVLPQTGTLAYSHASSIVIDNLTSEEMEKCKSIALHAGIKHVDTVIVEGLDVSTLITSEVTEKVHPDLIVIGDHKHHSLLDKVLGSTASGIVKKSSCSVFIVK